MKRIFITGSADGLGKLAARLMVDEGHRVVLHARNKARSKQALAAVPGAANVDARDLSSIAEWRQVAEQLHDIMGMHEIEGDGAALPRARAARNQVRPRAQGIDHAGREA